MSRPGGLGGLSGDPDEAMARIDSWAQGFAEKAQRYQAAQQQTERIRLTAASPDGAVRVTVGADGAVTDLEFANRARSIPLPELSAQILTTMRRAQADIATRVGEVMAEQLGDEDLQTRAVMLDSLRSRFPDPDPEPDAEPPEQNEQGQAPPDPNTAPGSQGAPGASSPPRAGNGGSTGDIEEEDNNPW